MYPYLPLGAGSVIALLYMIIATPNPAGVPARRVAWKAAPGLFLFLSIYFCLSWVLFSLLSWKAPAIVSLPHNAAIAIAFLTGIAVHALSRVKYLATSPQFFRNFPAMAGGINWLNERTESYLSGTISEEERQLSVRILERDRERRSRAIERLFELHNMEIVRRKVQEAVAELPPETTKAKVREVKLELLGLFRVRQIDFKLKYLIRHLKFPHTERLLDQMHCDLSVFPTWPPAEPDRRRESADEPQRRKYEHPYNIWYIFGGDDCRPATKRHGG